MTNNPQNGFYKPWMNAALVLLAFIVGLIASAVNARMSSETATVGLSAKLQAVEQRVSRNEQIIVPRYEFMAIITQLKEGQTEIIANQKAMQQTLTDVLKGKKQ